MTKKISINFNDNTFLIDEQSLSAATNALKSHLESAMSGSGATIDFGGTSYNVDSAKLSAATNTFISHLGTIVGSGSSVVVGGIEYAIDSTKVANAFSSLYTRLSDLTTPDSVEDLEKKYEFIYFSSMGNAVNAINAGTSSNYDATKETAAVGVYTDGNNIPNVVLLKDISEGYVKPTTDMVINLGGHNFVSTNNMGIYCSSGNIYLDGRLPGSGIKVETSDGTSARAILIDTASNLTIDGGTYTNIATNTTSAAVMARGVVTAKNATFIGKSTTARMDGFSVYGGSTVDIVNCNILVSGQNAKPNGIYISSKGNVTASNSTIKCYANYNHDGSSYTSSSLGVYQAANSTLTLNDCHVDGILAGIQTYGTLYINGGTYEGYGHGGFYFVGNQTTSYVRNATIREGAMPEEYVNNNGSNHVGFYIGTGSNNSIYVDNCIIECEGHAIVLRGSSGDSLYISNSRIGDDNQIRIDSTAQKLYLGRGNSFTIDDVTLPEAVIVTDDVYIAS